MRFALHRLSPLKSNEKGDGEILMKWVIIFYLSSPEIEERQMKRRWWNSLLFFRVYLSRQAEGHWEEGVVTDSGGIKGCAPGRIEAGFAHDVADEAEDGDEEEDEGGGDEEGWEEALDAEGRGDDGSQDAQGRHAEHPHARDHAIQDGHLHDTHPFLPSFLRSCKDDNNNDNDKQ